MISVKARTNGLRKSDFLIVGAGFQPARPDVDKPQSPKPLTYARPFLFPLKELASPEQGRLETVPLRTRFGAP